MSSKSKSKSNKSVSRTPQTPKSIAKVSVWGEPPDFEVKELLQEASNKFGFVIGTSAFFGKISDINTSLRGCKIWMSEISMVACSLVPGSIVSVSVAATGENYSAGRPLRQLSDNCRREGEKSDEVGYYFAMAAVFSSSKLSRTELKLSADLHFTLGRPLKEEFVFVYAIQNPSLGNIVNTSHENVADDAFLYQSKDLHLEFMYTKPRTSSVKKCEERVTSNDSDSIKEAIRDCTTNKILQSCAFSWLQSRVLLHGNLVNIPLLSNECVFTVKAPLPAGDEHFDRTKIYPVLVNKETKVQLSLPSDSTEFMGKREDEHFRRGVDLDRVKVGGLKKEYDTLMQIIASVTDTSISSLGCRGAKGVLLHGPPGTGKTSLALLCARDAGLQVFSIWGPEVIARYSGESEQAMSKIFQAASQAAPAVIFLDELDAIAPARKGGGEQLSRGMVACLLNLIDGINRDDGVLVIAASNRVDSIDPAVRRAGRLTREIEIGVPSPNQRYEIIKAIMEDRKHSLTDLEIHRVASSTHGFVGSDLSALCSEAEMGSFRRYRNALCEYKGCDVVELCRTDDRGEEKFAYLRNVTFGDFESARLEVRPSSMKGVTVEVPKVRWEDVGGQSEAKRQLKEAVEGSYKKKEAFESVGVKAPKGVLMFGPPGCSKTLLARVVASEAGLNFLAVKGPELFSKWVGESEKAVRSLFAKARANAPSVIFFDEIDALAVARGSHGDNLSVSDRVMSQLLIELDGLEKRSNVTVIGATNRPDKLDAALLRPGRFDRTLYVGPPNGAEREEIFGIHLRGKPCGGDVNVKELARLTEGYSGAAIASICNNAPFVALENDLSASLLKMEHFVSAIAQVRPLRLDDNGDLSSRFQRLVVSNSFS